MEMFMQATFWAALGNIILINIVLAGDNAVVIALAARQLPPKQQRQAILYGSGAAIVKRIILTIFAVKLLTLPWRKIVCAVLLVNIGVQLLMDGGDGDGHVNEHGSMAAAIKTILGAAQLGRLAVEMIVSDPKMVEWLPHFHHVQELVIVPDKFELCLAGLAGAALVVVLGKLVGARRPPAT